jgi:hypothetical protein
MEADQMTRVVRDGGVSVARENIEKDGLVCGNGVIVLVVRKMVLFVGCIPTLLFLDCSPNVGIVAFDNKIFVV